MSPLHAKQSREEREMALGANSPEPGQSVCDAEDGAISVAKSASCASRLCGKERLAPEGEGLTLTSPW